MAKSKAEKARDDRAFRRRQVLKDKKQEEREDQMKVYIPIPSPFLDDDSYPWTWTRANTKVETLDFTGVLAHTLDKAPVPQGEQGGNDAQKALDMKHHTLACDDPDSDQYGDGYLHYVKDDYDWLVKHLKQNAHLIWHTGNGAFLTRYIQNKAINEKDLDEDIARRDAELDAEDKAAPKDPETSQNGHQAKESYAS